MKNPSVKCVFIGDPHFQVSNIVEVDLFLERIEKLCKEREPDFIVIAGDLLHTHERLHTLALNKAYEFVDRMRAISKTYVLVGNHDMCNNQQFLTDNHWMNGMKEWDNVRIVDKVVVESFWDERFVFLPYVPPGRFEEALESLEDSESEMSKDWWKECTCLFAHQEFAGCKMGAIVSVDGDKWDLEYPDVVSGHIHSRQRPQRNVYYSGSAMQHAFGESEKNIIAILEWSNGWKEEMRGESGGKVRENSYDLEEVDLGLPRKRIVYKDIEEMDSYVIPGKEEEKGGEEGGEENEESVKEDANKGVKDKIKVTISGGYEKFKAFKKTKKYKEIVESGVKVVFKPRKIKKMDKGSEKKSESLDNGGDEEGSSGGDFKAILDELVNKERNPFLNEVYEEVVNEKTVRSGDILFL